MDSGLDYCREYIDELFMTTIDELLFKARLYLYIKVKFHLRTTLVNNVLRYHFCSNEISERCTCVH